jgi:hypothetical protein
MGQGERCRSIGVRDRVSFGDGPVTAPTCCAAVLRNDTSRETYGAAVNTLQCAVVSSHQLGSRMAHSAGLAASNRDAAQTPRPTASGTAASMRPEFMVWTDSPKGRRHGDPTAGAGRLVRESDRSSGGVHHRTAKLARYATSSSSASEAGLSLSTPALTWAMSTRVWHSVIRLCRYTNSIIASARSSSIVASLISAAISPDPDAEPS